MIDKKENYYLFMHQNPNRNIINHRLGNFKVSGLVRPAGKYVKVIILHIMDYDKYFPGHEDLNAERISDYFSKCSEYASSHINVDRDSFDIMLPPDVTVTACANPNTAQESVEIEIAGTFKDHANPEYWHTDDAKKKLINTAKALKQLKILCDFDMPSLQIAKLNEFGNVIQSGFLQHRDVPIFKAGAWHQYPDNIKFGQHNDICQDFPSQILFDIISSEFRI